MNEAETRAELIDPDLKTAGWGEVDGSRVRREVITLGRLQGAGRRTGQDIADYVLFYRGQKLAVIEAKRKGLPDTEGVVIIEMLEVESKGDQRNVADYLLGLRHQAAGKDRTWCLNGEHAGPTIFDDYWDRAY